MNMQLVLLCLISAAELVLFVLLFSFFSRLRKSEELLVRLKSGQHSLLERLQANAELEKELMTTFAERQNVLQGLNTQLEERVEELRMLLGQTDRLVKSPQFIREVITRGKRQGRTALQLAKATGLSLDEVELILAQSNE